MRNSAVGNLDELIKLLQEIREDYLNDTLYVNDGTVRVSVIESTLTDNSKVHDIRIR